MPRKRPLSPEDRALWEQIARTTTPLHPERPPAPEAAPRPAASPKPPPGMPAPQPRILPARPGAKPAPKRTSHDLVAPVAERMNGAPVHMDRKTHGRMKRGKLVPEARIDMHGMSLSEAHPALINFVLASHTRGMRLVLVITGKGKDRDYGGPIPTPYGVLRHQVPHWLRMVPLGPLVLQITPASRKHGGEGAYYVYLRRRR